MARARAAASRCARAGRAARARRRPAAARSPRRRRAIAKPNFESAWPVEIFSWVSPLTSGVTRTSTGWPVARDPRARPRPRARSSRSISSKLSITIAPTRWRSAMRSSASDLALPCSTIRSGRKPASQREVQLAAGGRVAPQALLREQRQHGACRGTPSRRTRRGSPRGRRRGRPARTLARARADRPRRPRRRACRTRAPARSCRSRRPRDGRAR